MIFYTWYCGWFWMFVFWVAFLWLLIWLISRNTTPAKMEKTDLEIARKRYAKGEITKKEFNEIKKELAGR